MNGDDILVLIKDTLSLQELDMDGEAQWDSLDQVTLIQKLDDKFEGKIDKLPESSQQELGIAMTPRKVINILKKNNLVE